ncbi:MAG: cyclic nucleotide-binding domain-containing protein [Acidobacteriota bacterium]
MALFSRSDRTDPLDLLRQGKFPEAAKVLEKRLAQSPDDLSVKLRLAEAYEGCNRRDEAARLYREEAESAMRSGQRAQATALLRKALRLFPEDAEILDRMRGIDGVREASAPAEAFSFDLEAPAEPPAPAVPPDVSREPPAESGFHESGEGIFATLHALMPDLSADDLGRLSALLRERTLSKGEVLVREGEAGGSLFIVSRGLFEVRGTFAGEELDLGTLGRGDVIGEVSLLHEVPRTATVTAVEPSVVLEMETDNVSRLLNERHDLRARLEAVVETRVRQTLDLLKKKDVGSDDDTQS